MDEHDEIKREGGVWGMTKNEWCMVNEAKNGEWWWMKMKRKREERSGKWVVDGGGE